MDMPMGAMLENIRDMHQSSQPLLSFVDNTEWFVQEFIDKAIV